MADHADHLFPGLHFLTAQLGGEQAQQQQFVRATVQMEVAARQVIDLLVFFIIFQRVGFTHGEQAVATARDGVAQFDRHGFQQFLHALAFQLPTAVQQLACGDVGERHALDAVTAVGEQQHRHRRVLHHGVEQQLALHQCLALLAQHFAEFGVGFHQLRELIIAAPMHTEVVLAVAVAAGGAGQRTQQRADRRGRAMQCVPHQGKQDDGGAHHDQPAMVHPVGEHPRQCRRQCEHGQQAQEQAEGEGAWFHRDILIRAGCRDGPCGGTAPDGSSPVPQRPGQ
ncbi:hypothetical protein D3C71_1322660 [compost metagenome]